MNGQIKKVRMYKVNVSAIQEFMRCRYRWWAKYVMNWVPRAEALPLRFGNLLHDIFEEAARIDISQAIEVVKDEWFGKAMDSTDAYERDSRMKAIEALDDLEEALALWKDTCDFENPFIEVENPFEIPHPNDSRIILQGRPDRVALMDGRLWHIQNRGLSPSVNFGVYLELAKRHYHEHLYAEALSYKYPDIPYGGTVFNLVRKLKYRTKNGKVKQLSEMFQQYSMVVSLKSELHKNIMNCILEYALSMQREEELYHEEKVIPLPNEYMNGGMYGNSPDIYFKTLIGEIELGDPRFFKKREDLYEPQTRED